ncbi:MAG TPA: hypothetical protein VFU11_05085 [Solirubrobacterales bacterium]|nr:hypothetical protein [Solirubrobacterales bacterium]
MTAATTVALVLLSSILLWLFAGMALRFVGLLLFFAGLLQVGLGATVGNGLLAAAAGGLLWLLGQFHFALRHHDFKSPLARHLFARLPASLNPCRGWAVQTIDLRQEGRRGQPLTSSAQQSYHVRHPQNRSIPNDRRNHP